MKSLILQYNEKFSPMPALLMKSISNQGRWQEADKFLEKALKNNEPIKDWEQFAQELLAS